MKTFTIELFWKSKTVTAIYAVLIAFFLSLNLASAQAFIDTSKTWSIITRGLGGGPYHGNLITTHFKFYGETIIKSEVYSILHKSGDVNLQDWKIDSFWREKNDSIFKKYADSDDLELIYDFTLQKNDSFYIGMDLGYMYVDSVNTINWGGKKRKHIYLSSQTGYQTVWRQGVGQDGLITRSSETEITGAIINILCFSENGELVYQNPKYNSCSINTSVPIIKKEHKLIKAYASREHTIEVHPLNGNSGLIQFFDTMGKQIIQKEIALGKIQITLPSKGAYFYRFINQTGELQTGKIMVK